MSSDLSTGSASRESVTAPRDVVAPFGVRERLAGLGQVSGLLQCRERDDLDGQTRVRGWLDQHPVGTTSLIICLAECACEAITDRRGGSNALAYVHSMTSSRLTQQYQVLLAEIEGLTAQELGGYLWGHPASGAVMSRPSCGKGSSGSWAASPPSRSMRHRLPPVTVTRRSVWLSLPRCSFTTTAQHRTYRPGFLSVFGKTPWVLS
jgi:hypothetical protein